jgi:hypothetical protein
MLPSVERVEAPEAGACVRGAEERIGPPGRGIPLAADADGVETWTQTSILWPASAGQDLRVRLTPTASAQNVDGYRAGARSRVHWVSRTDQYDDNAYLLHNVAFDGGRGVFVVSEDVAELPALRGVAFVRGPLPTCSAARTVRAPWLWMPMQTAHNVYHVHNDNLLPLYSALDVLNATLGAECAALRAMRDLGIGALADAGLPSWSRCGAADAPAGSAGDVPTLVVTWRESTSGAQLFDAMTRTLVARVVGSRDDDAKKTLGQLVAAAVGDGDAAGLLCLGTALVGRVPRMFRPSVERALPYVSRRIVPRAVRVMLHSMHLLQAWARPVPRRPRAIFFQRPKGEMRFLESEAQLATLFHEFQVKLDLVDPAKLSPAQQAEAAARADIVVGVHGAALGWCLYLRPGSVCVEIRPHSLPAWESTLFSRFSLAAGGIEHLTLREDFGPDYWKEGSVTLSRLKSPSRDLRAFAVQVVLAWSMASGRFRTW